MVEPFGNSVPLYIISKPTILHLLSVFYLALIARESNSVEYAYRIEVCVTKTGKMGHPMFLVKQSLYRKGTILDKCELALYLLSQ